MGFGNADKTLTMKRRAKGSTGQASATAAPPLAGILRSSKLHDLRYTAAPVDASRKATKALPRRRIIQTGPANCQLMRQVSSLGMGDAASPDDDGTATLVEDDKADHQTTPPAAYEYDQDDDDELSISDLLSVTSDPTFATAADTATETKRLSRSLQDDVLMGKTMMMRPPRKSRRKQPVARKGSSTATLMTSCMNASGSSLDMEQVMNDGSRSLLDSSAPSLLTTTANSSRRTLHDSVSSTDSNTIVRQAALAELHRSQNTYDSSLIQEALKSVGDLMHVASVAPEVTLEAAILDSASSATHRPMPSMEDVFQATKLQPIIVIDASNDSELTKVTDRPTTDAEETKTEQFVQVSNSDFVTPKKENKIRIIRRNRNLMDRMHASVDCIDFDFTSSATVDVEAASPMIHSPHKKKIQLGSRHSKRYPGSISSDVVSSRGNDQDDTGNVMDKHAAMLAFTRRAPRVSRSIGAPSAGKTAGTAAKRRPTMA